MATRFRLCSVIGAVVLGYAALGASPAAAEATKPAGEEPSLSTENATPFRCKWVQGPTGWVCFELKKPH